MNASPLILTVSQLTRAIKLHLEKQFPHVVVQGEVSNFKKQSSNHLYFTLKDPQSQIQCAMFYQDARHLKKLPKNGDQIEVRGEINVYPPRGNYQMIVRSLKLAGIGELLMALQERKEKYLSLGYFDAQNKKPLPHLPKRIGVVTSPTGAVINDILQILRRRAHGFHLILNPVKVQGDGAAAEIAKAIDDFNKHNLVDVLIVGRGGGSLEDLWAFNEEPVIESIYKSRIPIITAIGHETDTTLSDLASDLRAPTPSAAAELVIAEKEGQFEFLRQAKNQLDHHVRKMIQQKKEALGYLTRNPLLESPQNLLRFYEQKVDEVQMQLDYAIGDFLKLSEQKLQRASFSLEQFNPRQSLQKTALNLSQIKQKIDFSIRSKVQNQKALFEKLCTHLEAINPQNVLKKGYSILFDEKRSCAIVSTKDIALKQKLKLILTDGSCEAVVEAVDCKDDEKPRSPI